MKLTTGIVALAMTAGMAWAQNPASIIQNTKSSLQGAQQQKSADVNSALQAAGTSTSTKPSPATASNHPSSAPAPAPAKAAVAPAAPAPTVKVVQTKTAPAPAKIAPAAMKAAPAPAKVAPVAMKAAPAPAKVTPPPPGPKAAAKPATPAVPPATTAPAAAAATAPKPAKPEEKKYSMTGKRDPFISPVVNRQGGSGCSTGKKCLDIDQIAVRGVVKADTGMIAVVTNGLNKAYFLRENDPVFNGYVVKITVDSVVFKQNFQDRLGKPFTKDVVKRLTTPAV
jgi:Tfp pilus assembly protein PilP